MKTIKIFLDRIEGEIVTDFLSKNGINCLFIGDDAGGTRPHLGAVTGYKLQVNEEDVAEAKKIIASFENSKSQ